MSDPFDADELWFAHLLASVPTPASLERAAARTARPASGRRRRYRTLVLAGGLALVVGVLGGLVLGLTRAGDKSAGAPATGSAVPASRVQPGLAGDDVHQDVVLFGGRGPGGVMADTWIWDGHSWSQRHPLHSPSPRRGPAMASDPAGGGVLLVGGTGPKGEALADNWEWDGTDWQLLAADGAPGARAGAVLSQDPVAERVVLFGGQGAADARGSTWSWTGRLWIQETPADAPSNCGGASMAFDDATRRLVLVTGRGCSAAGASGATWTWDGHDWSRLRPAASPPPGDGDALAYDDASQLLILSVPRRPRCATRRRASRCCCPRAARAGCGPAGHGRWWRERRRPRGAARRPERVRPVIAVAGGDHGSR
ncbi:MAG: hypothetical protein E6J03_05575 [Chloroflexi bacterium]|nr:MAG: hypothetical protein E6J03_05575 [Chloroflexota bacterium]